MLNPKMIQNYLGDLIAQGFSENTVRAYCSDLEGLYAYVQTDPFVNQTLEAWAASYLNQGRKNWAPKTTCRKLTAFRSYGNWSKIPGFLNSYKPPTPSKTQPHPIPEGIAGVVAMIERTRNPLHKALLALNGLMGLRIDECIHITPECFNLDEMTLKVRGKGDKTRVIPVSPRAWEYIQPRYEYVLKYMGKAFLVPYSNRGARAAISRHGRNAGLSRHVASHDLRATVLTAAYAKTKDLRAVQELAGHADPKTTMLYTGVSMEAMREAANL